MGCSPVFSHLPTYAGDPIFELVARYARDGRPDKVNLSVGIYYDDRGEVPLLECIKQAERRYLSLRSPIGYLPIEGDARYRQAVRRLVFGEDSDGSDRVTVVQTVGGSGALKVGADFLKRVNADSRVWLSNPTWDNHVGVFTGAGFNVSRYAYYDADTQGLDFGGMVRDLRSCRRGDIVLLAPCCHNPTGVDPTREQWKIILDVIEEWGSVPFIDMAYQGFADGLDADAWLVRELVKRKMNCLVSTSFSKNFSLYGERCGSLSVYSADPGTSADVLGQLQLCIRQNYSSPPTHGMALVSVVLDDAELRQLWVTELAGMRERIRAIRAQFQLTLQILVPHIDSSFLLRQTGMFAYTGLREDQINRLREQHAVYALASGRICIAGLNSSNVDHAAHAFQDVMQ